MSAENSTGLPVSGQITLETAEDTELSADAWRRDLLPATWWCWTVHSGQARPR